MAMMHFAAARSNLLWGVGLPSDGWFQEDSALGDVSFEFSFRSVRIWMQAEMASRLGISYCAQLSLPQNQHYTDATLQVESSQRHCLQLE